MGEVQQRAGGCANGGGRDRRSAADPGHEHGDPGCLGGASRGTEVLRVRDPVEGDHDVVLGERPRGEIALGELPGVTGPRRDTLMSARERIQLAPRNRANRDAAALGRREDISKTCPGPRRLRHKDLSGPAGADGLRHGAPTGHQGAG